MIIKKTNMTLNKDDELQKALDEEEELTRKFYKNFEKTYNRKTGLRK